ncbi:MAG: hypothetical protein AAF391_11740 [Bacteroidota bacterium]
MEHEKLGDNYRQKLAQYLFDHVENFPLYEQSDAYDPEGSTSDQPDNVEDSGLFVTGV